MIRLIFLKEFVKLVTITAVSVGGSWAFAEASASSETTAPTRAITLKEAIALAVQQNPTLAASIVDLRIADARVLEASGIDDFVLRLDSGWQSNRTDIVPGQSGPYDKLSLGAALTQPLPTGGSIGLRYGTDFTNFPSSESQSEALRMYNPSLLLAFSYPLLRGAGVGVARANRRRVGVARDVATLRREAMLASLLRDVSQAYLDLGYSTAELQIRRSSLELAREQLRVVEANISVWKLPPSASAEVEVAVALRQEEALLAEQTVREQSFELRRLLGLSIGPGEPVLVAAESPESEAREVDANEALEEAMAHNPELHAARAQGKAALIEMEVTENGLLPQLDFSVNAGPVGNAEDLSRAFGQLGRFEGYVVQAGLVFTQPLERRTARGQATAARESLHRARLGETDITAQIQTGVMKAVDFVGTAKRRIDALSKVIDLANLDLSAEKARFELGRASNFDVLRRQDELARAQLRQARARTDYLKAVAILEALTTEILSHHGVNLR